MWCADCGGDGDNERAIRVTRPPEHKTRKIGRPMARLCEAFSPFKSSRCAYGGCLHITTWKGFYIMVSDFWHTKWCEAPSDLKSSSCPSGNVATSPHGKGFASYFPLLGRPHEIDLFTIVRAQQTMIFHADLISLGESFQFLRDGPGHANDLLLFCIDAKHSPPSNHRECRHVTTWKGYYIISSNCWTGNGGMFTTARAQ